MRLLKILPLLVVIALVLALAIEIAQPAVIGLWLAPQDDCEGAIVEQFDKAEKSIHYQMYNFTAPAVADALIAAHKRGVEVVLLLDHGAVQSPHSQAKRCDAAGCRVFVDRSHPIAHNKIRIIDGRLTFGGSYNDSAQAKHNAENLTLDDDPEIAARFEANFQAHLAEEKTKTWKQSHAADLNREKQKARAR